MNQPPKDFSAVLCSAFAFPGTGQFLQKRWLAGIFFAVTVTFFFLLAVMIAAWAPLYNWALHLAAAPADMPRAAFHGRWALVSFLISLALQAWNIFDAWRGARFQGLEKDAR